MFESRGPFRRTSASPRSIPRTLCRTLALTLLALSIVGLDPVRAGHSAPDHWFGDFSAYGADGEILSIQAVDEGLLIGGTFMNIGRTRARHLALWNGSEWQEWHGGTDGAVSALLQRGDSLLVFGAFGHAGGVSARHAAVWRGGVWSALGIGPATQVRAATCAGQTIVTSGVRRRDHNCDDWQFEFWDGTIWTPRALPDVTEGARTNVVAMTSFDAQAVAVTWYCDPGEEINVFYEDAYPLMGQAWGEFELPQRMYGVDAAIPYRGEYLVAGGWGPDLRHATVLGDGSTWRLFDPPGDRRIDLFAYHDTTLISSSGDAPKIAFLERGVWVNRSFGAPHVDRLSSDGRTLYASGRFEAVHGQSAIGLAAWNGEEWHSLGDHECGEGANGQVLRVTGFGDRVMVRGSFTRIGKESLAYHAIRRPDGWSQFTRPTHGFTELGALGDKVLALGAVPLPDGGRGETIAWWTPHASELLGSVEGSIASSLAFDGEIWICGSNLSVRGADGGSAVTGQVAWFDGNSWRAEQIAPDLYPAALARVGDEIWVGGGSRAANPGWVRRRTKQDWETVGPPLPWSVSGVSAVGGAPISIGGLYVPQTDQRFGRLAQWNGSGWVEVAEADSWITCFVSYNGSLIVGGAFSRIGDVLSPGISRWDGTNWSAMDGGTNGRVSSLSENDEGLWVGGDFQLAGGRPAANLALWRMAAPPLESFSGRVEGAEVVVNWSYPSDQRATGVVLRYSFRGGMRNAEEGIPLGPGYVARGSSDVGELRIPPPAAGSPLYLAAFARDEQGVLSPARQFVLAVPDLIPPTATLAAAADSIGLRVDLVVSEPLVPDRVGVTFDERPIHLVAEGSRTVWRGRYPSDVPLSGTIRAVVTDSVGNRSEEVVRVALGIRSQGHAWEVQSPDARFRAFAEVTGDEPAGRVACVQFRGTTEDRAYHLSGAPRQGVPFQVQLLYASDWVVEGVPHLMAIFLDGRALPTWIDAERSLARATATGFGRFSLGAADTRITTLVDPAFVRFTRLGVNPVISEARWQLEVHAQVPASVAVFDLTGRRLREIDLGILDLGSREVRWDTRDSRGRRVPAGIYLCRAQVGNQTRTDRVCVLR
ncbi:MAG: hypothetical protein IPK72_04125 [Candidatus Eisenbacteria bacterium]|nr:hypothetical protein [Candidatus Eisenbacteria bacterium]